MVYETMFRGCLKYDVVTVYDSEKPWNKMYGKILWEYHGTVPWESTAKSPKRSDCFILITDAKSFRYPWYVLELKPIGLDEKY